MLRVCDRGRSFFFIFQKQLLNISQMSFADLKSLVEPYLTKFPENILFRAKLHQNHLNFRKQYVYFGQTTGQMRHGSYGICFSFAANQNLLIYEGAWANDQYNGKGSLFLLPRNNTKQYFKWYSGQWKNGKLNGKGMLKEYKSQEQEWQVLYKGEFRDHYKHGYGIQYFNNDTYEGYFQNGVRHGKGRLTDALGNFYDGNFNKGLPQGRFVQRKGAEIMITDEQGNSKLFQVPQSVQQMPVFFLNVIELI